MIAIATLELYVITCLKYCLQIRYCVLLCEVKYYIFVH